MDGSPDVTRRRALSWGAAAAALALGASACGRAGASTRESVAASIPVMRPHPEPTTPAAHARVVAVKRPAGHPGALHHEPVGPAPWTAPIYSLSQYRQRFPGTKFPRDAIMLTIDDGPDPTWTPKILRLLQRHDVRATFCSIGAHAASFPSLLRAVAGDGHHLANHTFTHPLALPNLSPAQIRSQIVDTQDAIVRASGITPALFRSPGGNWGRRVFAGIAPYNLTPLDWDVDPRDWSVPGTAHIVATMLAAQPGDVVLCHDGGGNRSETYAALATVVPKLKARGLQFVTLPA
jgi:peptidoglycan/xylan/chitin deacetylase (PgdA/CDA1 family)